MSKFNHAFNHAPKRHLIIGQGAIGKPLAERLSGAGHEVVALACSPKVYEEQVVFWQKNALDLTAQEVQGFDSIAIIITPDDKMSDRVEAYRASYLAVCEHIAGLDLASVGRVLFVSSTSVYGQNAGEQVDITTPANPTAPTAGVLLQAEQALQSAFGERCVVVRPSGIYTGASERMKALAKHAHQEGVPSAHYINRIHRTDLIEVLYQVLTLPEACPLYIASDTLPSSSLDVLGFLCQKYGYPAPTVIDAPPTGKRIRGNVDEWLTFGDYKMGYGE